MYSSTNSDDTYTSNDYDDDLGALCDAFDEDGIAIDPPDMVGET